MGSIGIGLDGVADMTRKRRALPSGAETTSADSSACAVSFGEIDAFLLDENGVSDE